MSFIKWLFTDHYFNNKQGVIKFLGTLLFIFLAIAVPGPALEEYNGGWIPIWPVIGSFYSSIRRFNRNYITTLRNI